LEYVKQGVEILVVDDEPLVRHAIKMLLQHAGHKVWQADSGEAALEQLAQRSFDLIITDFSMPGMHGDQLVARIRQLLPAQPIIMATAFAEEYKVFGQPGGNVDALLVKPFTLQELHAAIAHVLGRPPPDQPNVSLPDHQPPPAQDSFLPPAMNP
jgi:CheY-like chemotaxis protein